VSEFWNNTYYYPFPDAFTRHSIFHHITDPATGDTLIRNRMMTMSEDFVSGRFWDTIILDLNGISHFWLAMFPTGSQDQRWWEAVPGSAVVGSGRRAACHHDLPGGGHHDRMHRQRTLASLLQLEFHS
jgi:hypothetical protein